MSHETGAILIFFLVMTMIVSERVHRTAASILGAVLLFVTGILNVETAAGYIDVNTIGVLVGMMLFVAVVKKSGIFEYLAVKAAKASGGNPRRMMVIFMVITALLSSMLDNVTTVLLMGPVTLSIAKTMGLNPVPFIITQIMASNIGGTATLIGDPPNIMLGSAAGITFMEFILHNGPVVVIILLVTMICCGFLYRRQLLAEPGAVKKIMMMDEAEMITDQRLLRKSAAMTAATVFGFAFSNMLGIETSVIALAAAAVMLITGKKDIEGIVRDVEWTTILFFIGLFIVVGGLVETGVIEDLAHVIMDVTHGNALATMLTILWLSALLSSALDNIPFIATMIPLISSLGAEGMDPMPLWWALSLGACLGGNGTLIGASANVVLAGVSEKYGYPITYMQFLKAGFPLMVLSIAICTVYLLVLYAV